MGPSLIDLLSGRLVGLTCVPVEELRRPGQAGVCRIRADLAETTATVGVPLEVQGGVAAAFGREAARQAAVAEALERYSAMHVDPRRLRRAPAAELRAGGQRLLDPHRLTHFLDAQYGSTGFRLARPPADDDPIPWLPGIDLVTGELVHVPAARVAYCRDGGQPWYPSTTNGTAVAADPIAASLAGLLELLERDAFMLMWYHRLRFPRLDLDRDTHLAFTERFAGSGLDLTLIDLTEVHDVPTVVAIASGRGAFGVGAAARLDPLDAARKAFCEAVAVHAAASGSVIPRRLTAADVRTFDDHTDYYLDPQHHAELDFLLDPRPHRPPPATGLAKLDPPAALRLLTSRLRDRGIQTVTVDLTPVEVEHLDLHAYAVVSPQLLALDGAHTERQLGNPRLLTEPTRRGWRPDSPTLAGLNHAPHPFP